MRLSIPLNSVSISFSLFSTALASSTALLIAKKTSKAAVIAKNGAKLLNNPATAKPNCFAARPILLKANCIRAAPFCIATVSVVKVLVRSMLWALNTVDNAIAALLIPPVARTTRLSAKVIVAAKVVRNFNRAGYRGFNKKAATIDCTSVIMASISLPRKRIPSVIVLIVSTNILPESLSYTEIKKSSHADLSV